MQKYLIFALLLTVMVSQAQVKNLSAYLRAGIPVIPSVESGKSVTAFPIPAATGYSFTTMRLQTKESFSNRWAVDVGAKLDYGISSKFYLTSGLSVHYAQFQRNVQVTGIDAATGLLPPTLNPPAMPVSGLPFGMIYANSYRNPDGSILIDQEWRDLAHSEDLGKTSTLAMQLPVLVGTSFFNNKLQLRTGPVFSYLLASSEVKQRYANAILSEYKDTSKGSFNEFQAGISCQTTFMLGTTVGIDFGVQKFFTSLYRDEHRVSGNAKYNVVSLGVSYNLL